MLNIKAHSDRTYSRLHERSSGDDSEWLTSSQARWDRSPAASVVLPVTVCPAHLLPLRYISHRVLPARGYRSRLRRPSIRSTPRRVRAPLLYLRTPVSEAATRKLLF